MSNPIHIVNNYSLQRTKDLIDFNVGSATILGNKWTCHPRRMTPKKYIVESQQTAVACYRIWLADQLLNPKSDAYREIQRIARINKTWPVNLVCYCAGPPCHAEVIKEEVEKINNYESS